MSGQVIREIIKNIAGEKGKALFTAEVISTTATHCTLSYGGSQLTDVKLFSIDEAGTLLLKPALGSMVTVADLSGGQMRDLCLVKIDKLQQVRFEFQNMMFDLDGATQKLEINSNGISLKSLFADLADILKSLKVAVIAPNSPSGTITPDCLALVNKFETEFKTLLK